MKTASLMISAFFMLGTASAYADEAAGKALYTTNCVKCHGGKGQGGVGLRLAGDAAYWTFDVFKRAVTEGQDDENRKLKAIMPRFGKVGLAGGVPPTDDELKSIQAYLMTLGPKK